MSATGRSLIYAVAMARSANHGRLSVVPVEVLYVSLTAGIFAGMQQKALAFRSRFLGNFIIVVAVPGTAQVLDWIAHRVTQSVTPRAILAVSIFALISALFHLHVMRNGVFLSGQGRSLLYDFRRLPRLIGGFVWKPVMLLASSAARLGESESEASI